MPPIQPFTITRKLPAPRDLVFQVHTERRHLVNWFGPAGTKVLKCDIDFRVGGRNHYGTESADGKRTWGLQTYLEIKAPEKLVFLQAFSDESGAITRHPMAPTWPRQMQSTIRFEEDHGATLVTVTWVPFEADEGEVNTFNAAHAGMTQGFQGMFQVLEAYLAECVKTRL